MLSPVKGIINNITLRDHVALHSVCLLFSWLHLWAFHGFILPTCSDRLQCQNEHEYTHVICNMVNEVDECDCGTFAVDLKQPT